MAHKPPCSHGSGHEHNTPKHADVDRMVETARMLITEEVADYKLGFGFSELRELVKRRRETPGKLVPSQEYDAQQLAVHVRKITNSVLQNFGMRYRIETVQRSYQDALGDQTFSGGHEVHAGMAGWDLIETVLNVSEKTLDTMQSAVLVQADSQIRSRMAGEAPETADERVGRFIRDITDREKTGLAPMLGNDMEDLRSALGLRTLNALLQRYLDMDRRGRECALNRAFAWSERGYDLTRHTIQSLSQDDSLEGSQRQDLTALGLAFSLKLGKEKLGGSFEGRDLEEEYMRQHGITQTQVNGMSKRIGEGIDSGTKGWDIIDKAKEIVPKTWRAMKEIIPKRKTEAADIF